MSKQSILIVDDNSTNIQVLNEVLHQSYTIFFATSGQDALNIIHKENPDLILLDIMMPEMDGYEVCNRLKKNPETSEIPVIFVTAMAEVMDETKGLELGAVDYITKPISAPIVKARVKSHLNLVEQTNEVRKAYRDLKSSQSKLLQQEKMVSIGQLADGIAHEINTPIQYITTNIDFFKEAFDDLFRLIANQNRLLDAAENGKTLELIVSEIRTIAEEIDPFYLEDELPRALAQSLGGLERISEIIKAMKEFADPHTEQDSFVDVNKAIQTTADMARNMWHEEAELLMKLDQNLPMVSAVAGEFSKVILNLIVNAAQAIKETDTANDAKGRITISTEQTTDRVLITIMDNGSGIADEHISRIFEPFFTTKEVGKGTGLGLSIAYSIIEKHGGELTVESELGKGTSFTIKLKAHSKTT